MSTNLDEGPSIADRVRVLDVGTAQAIYFLGATPVFVLGERELVFVEGESTRRVAVHGDAILSSASNGKHVFTGSDDGVVAATSAMGDTAVLARDGKRRWIDHLAAGPDGAVAWSAGKSVGVRSGKGIERAREVVSSVGGLAFLPKGFRLAIAHYNGVSLWFPNLADAPIDSLDWKGSHRGVTVSADGKFLVTTMQEPALHGWRVADKKDMRMSGYPARIRSMNWSADGAWLATSGAEQLILWPFQSKDGPMGKQPKVCAVYPQRVTAVACHPREGVVAVGYMDGMILLVRIEDGAEVLVRHPGGGAVATLAWDKTGKILAFAIESGEAGLVAV